jgi:hypothetical protein
VALVVLGVVGGLMVRRARRGRGADPAVLALKIASNWNSDSKVAPAIAVIERLTEYLERVEGRPSGELTPPEARAAIERLTSDRGLADRAEGLVRWCDRVRFGTGNGNADEGRLIDEARGLFREVARAIGREKRGLRKPKEAAGPGRTTR